MKKKHSAAGPAAGYLFQFERALLHLAKSPTGALVGIETLDDVSVIQGNGEVLLEQTKSTLGETNPLSDSSVELWKTLSIWTSEVANGSVDPSITRFYLVSTRAVSTGSLADILENGTLDERLAKVKSVGAEIQLRSSARSEETKKFVDAVLESPRLSDVLERIEVEASGKTHGQALDSQILEYLRIPENVDPAVLLQQLKGWMQDVVLTKWRANEQAWIRGTEFNHQFFQAARILHKKHYIERLSGLIMETVNEEQKGNLSGAKFVRQIIAVFEERSSFFVSAAIEDYLCCESERVRLCIEGALTKSDFQDFEDRLLQLWRINRESSIGELEKNIEACSPDELVKVGKSIYRRTVQSGHRESLGGHATEQFYLTRGSYHSLADQPRLGWHPKYEDMFSKKEISPEVVLEDKK
jgi:hypothetical protein